MRLTVYSDYAFRVLIYLATHRDKLCTIREISDAYGISKNHLMKLVHELGKAGFIDTVRGRSGGLRLLHAPSEVGLGDVLRVTEYPPRLVECFQPDTNACRISGACRLKPIMSEALEAFLMVFDKYTLADITTNRDALLRLIGPVSPCAQEARNKMMNRDL